MLHPSDTAHATNFRIQMCTRTDSIQAALDTSEKVDDIFIGSHEPERYCLQARQKAPLNVAQDWALRELSRTRISGLNALHVAAALGDDPVTLWHKSLDVAGQAHPDKISANGCTPLMLVALNPAAAPRTAAELLALHANPKRVNIAGLNALHFAARLHDNSPLLAVLIGAGICPLSITPSSKHHATGVVSVVSPLQLAARRGRTHNVLYMLSFAEPGSGITLRPTSQPFKRVDMSSVRCCTSGLCPCCGRPPCL